MAEPDDRRAGVGFKKAATMKTYRMLVREVGEAPPVELIAEMRTDGRAVDFAMSRLTEQPRILDLEVWSGVSRLARLQRQAA